MSFPPRPPMGMPPMPPYQGYGFPVGMMPMGMPNMGMMGGVMQPNAPSTNSSGKPTKKLVPQEIPKDSANEKPPVTTVFVGNISDRAPDSMIKQMLQRCGNVLSWKRVQGASGKLQAFGFCEYEQPEATLRCIRLLNEWIIADKKLVVKVDAKTKTLLDEYKRKKRAREAAANGAANKEEKKEEELEEGEESGEIVENGDDDKKDVEIEILDEFTLREDRVAKAGLDAIMREYSTDLAKTPPNELIEEKKQKKMPLVPPPVIPKDVKEDGSLDEIEIEADKKDLISREIRSFRDTHKNVPNDEEAREAERQRERERERRRRDEEQRERERRERERERERREREREREREQREREKERERERERAREKERSRRRSRTPVSRSVSRERDVDDNDEDEEEAYERRKLERKLREKEAAYQERLKNWETRERKKARDYEKERDKEDERKSDESREARRLKEFLEDYDDERDDPKFYKGSALQRRLKEREKEMEADARDRQREKEEIEEIKRKLIEEGHPDLDNELARIEREIDEHLMPRLMNRSPSPEPQPEPEPVRQPVIPVSHHMKPIEAAPSVSSQSSPESDGAEPFQNESHSPYFSQDSSSQQFIGPSSRDDQQVAKMGFGTFGSLKSESPPSEPQPVPPPSQPKRKKLTVGEVFNQDDDDTVEVKKKRKLVPLDFEEEKKPVSLSLPNKPTTAEEKRKCIKNLIERIPTAKDELFAYPLDWTMVDSTLMDRRIKPWVNKKIVEYIGEEEPTLTEFICQKVMAHSKPEVILNDVAMVLDEEAEVFVVKMWRLLIYETEAKKLGLVK